MKIGIYTFYKSKENYGQVLQCFALQQVLRQTVTKVVGKKGIQIIKNILKD